MRKYRFCRSKAGFSVTNASKVKKLTSLKALIFLILQDIYLLHVSTRYLYPKIFKLHNFTEHCFFLAENLSLSIPANFKGAAKIFLKGGGGDF